MNVAALDYGAVRIGVAIADDELAIASPRPSLDGRDLPRAMARLKTLCADDEVKKIVVGLPLRLGGGEGPEATRARAFAERVAAEVGVVVELWDERLSTVQATRGLRASGLNAKQSRQKVDSAAACVILE
ncbi:MAG: Holliday junction resolvase RuvX, partial [Polyangiaceae bacterium]